MIDLFEELIYNSNMNKLKEMIKDIKIRIEEIKQENAS
jgi:hypothetical protein